jgi:hypothetical protein
MSRYDNCTIRLTYEEKEKLTLMAEEAGMSISDLVRETVLGGKKTNHNNLITNMAIMTYAIATEMASNQLPDDKIKNCKEIAQELAERLGVNFAFNGE